MVELPIKRDNAEELSSLFIFQRKEGPVKSETGEYRDGRRGLREPQDSSLGEPPPVRGRVKKNTGRA